MEIDYIKSLNLAQLATEIASAHGWPLAELSTSGSEQAGRLTVHRVDADPVKVQSVLDAHIPDPLFGAPEEDRGLAALHDKAVRVFNGQDSFTATEQQRILAGVVLYVTRD